MEDGRCKIVGGADRELSWVVLALQTSGASRGAGAWAEASGYRRYRVGASERRL